MKFKIRYADQIVGALAIVAILALVLTILLIGSKQRWFAKDYRFTSRFETATGLGVGMTLQYKGFTVGKITSVKLDDENLVDVAFSIYDTYYDRAKEGSVIELIVSPIGLGNTLLFHPGNGPKLIPENSFIPRADSPEGIALIASGQASVPKRDDTISNLVAQVQPLLTNINDTLTQLNGAFAGTGKGPLAETMNGVASTMTNVSGITGDLNGSIDGILANVEKMTDDFAALSEQLRSPDGLVPRLVDPDGKIFGSLQGSLQSIEGVLNNVEDSSSVLKSQVPQIARLIEDLRLALVQGQNVLEGLSNNPLLKNGISPKAESDSSGANARNVEF
jgi:phospholipid/cholesterol/gamma-HCH transport system substrate-binding protein